MPGPKLHIEDAGEGTAVVLLHGLTATHRYVVMGSRSLERSGHRVVTYDARGHGTLVPGAATRRVRVRGSRRTTWSASWTAAGSSAPSLRCASMGAHTALRLALAHPDRVAGLVVITPAYDERTAFEPAALEQWDALSDGLREGGVEGFLEAYGEPQVPPAWRETLLTVLRQRLGAHEHPDAVADALRTVPRSRPSTRSATSRPSMCRRSSWPTATSRIPGTRSRWGRPTPRRSPGADLVVEAPGASPIAWQGGRLSKLIARVASRGRARCVTTAGYSATPLAQEARASSRA